MEILFPNSLANDLSSPIFLLIAFVVTALGCVFATLFTVRTTSKKKFVGCCSCRSGGESKLTSHLNGGTNSGDTGAGVGAEEIMVEKVAAAVPPEKQTGASMMEQLVPEITTHALSYLDYPSLCRLSMTNSLMRKAANDDNAWKALYHKDFTLEQDSVTPVNGWKAYYAATRAIVNLNNEFFVIIKDRALAEMGRFWLNADYVKCFHASGEFFTG
ncbi:OLC1v1030067C2 [Oldenlandia corymbosa var. corymbosa]|nr:OLC1v1030067C2 [Oldenlandia corymbosa var. corymbosa]